MVRRHGIVVGIVKAAVLYFVLVFGAGALLGPFRVLWLVPRAGERAAELMELPVMFIVMAMAARWVVRRFGLASRAHALMVGWLAFALLLVAEFTLVLGLRGVSLADYLADRDPVAGFAYGASLIVFAFLPLLVAQRARRAR